MTQSEALEYYKRIEDFNTQEIRNLVEKELRPSLNQAVAGAAMDMIGRIAGALLGAPFGAVEGSASGHTLTHTPEEVEDICKDSIKNNSSTIKQILQKHPHYTNYVIDIIMLLAPAIAQQYIGISGLAIVGSITILCKQGIQAYLQ